MRKFLGVTGWAINDNDKAGGRQGSIIRTGRFALYREGLGTFLKGWWHFGWKRSPFRYVGFGVELGGEDNMLQFRVTLVVVAGAIGVRVPSWLTRKWVYQRRELVALSVGRWGSIIEASFMHDDDMDDMLDYYRRKREKEGLGEWMTRAMLWNGLHVRLRLRLRDLLLGRRKYTSEVVEERDVEIPMPDANYHAVWRHHRDTWKRPRWPWPMVRDSSEIEIPRGYPVPAFAGKGENSWDCDDDGFFSSRGPYRSPAESVGEYVKSVLRQRERHGSPREPALRNGS